MVSTQQHYDALESLRKSEIENRRLREALANAAGVLEVASDERYAFLKEREAESEKWKAEGDLYG